MARSFITSTIRHAHGRYFVDRGRILERDAGAAVATSGRRHVSTTDIYTYDAAQDGQRFLVNRFLKADHPTR